MACGFLFFRRQIGFHFVGGDHQFEFFVLDFPNLVFVTRDFVAERLELIVLARLVLLCSQARDRFRAGADIELHPFAIDLDLSRFLPERFDSGRAFRQLGFETFPLRRQGADLSLNLSDLLLSILKNEELFQFGMHAR